MFTNIRSFLKPRTLLLGRLRKRRKLRKLSFEEGGAWVETEESEAESGGEKIERGSWRERWRKRRESRRAFWIKRLEERATLAGQRKWIFLAIAAIVVVAAVTAIAFYYGAEIKLILRAWGLTL